MPAKHKFDLKAIQQKYDIDDRTLDYAKNICLKDIFDEFHKIQGDLNTVQTELLTKLSSVMKISHSLRSRIKDAEHLIEKVIRSVAEKPQKYSQINSDNYYKIITDLIGFRIIILNQNDWKKIHELILKIFTNDPDNYIKENENIVEFYDKHDDSDNKNGYIVEQPVVYITSETDREKYICNTLRIDSSKLSYRSIHYTIKYGDFFFEIQVRTLFEEGWLEFDHRIKYPYDRHNNDKQDMINILSSMAIAADKLIAFYDICEFKKKKESAPPIQINEIEHVEPEPQGGLKHKIMIEY